MSVLRPWTATEAKPEWTRALEERPTRVTVAEERRRCMDDTADLDPGCA